MAQRLDTLSSRDTRSFGSDGVVLEVNHVSPEGERF